MYKSTIGDLVSVVYELSIPEITKAYNFGLKFFGLLFGWFLLLLAVELILTAVVMAIGFAVRNANGGSKSAETGNGNNKAWAKALYRRAKPIISSYNEEEDYRCALEDLKRAVLLEPNDSTIRKELSALKKLLQSQKQQESAAFSKILQTPMPETMKVVPSGRRGVETGVEEPSQEPMSYKEAQNILEELRSKLEEVKARARSEGLSEEDGQVAKVTAILSEARSIAIAQRGKQTDIDFVNPSPETINDFMINCGIDLTEERTKRLLILIQQEHIAQKTGGASWRDESCTDMDMEIVKVSCAKLILEESANIAAYICKLLEDAHSPGLFARLLDNRKRFALADSKDEADSANMMKYMPPKVPCQTEKEEFLSALREDVMRFYWMQQWKKSASRNNSEVSLFHSLSKKYGWDTFEQLPEQERRTFLYLGGFGFNLSEASSAAATVEWALGIGAESPRLKPPFAIWPKGKLEQSPRAAEAGRNNKRASNLLAATINTNACSNISAIIPTIISTNVSTVVLAIFSTFASTCQKTFFAADAQTIGSTFP
eukprot:gene18225-18479_t